MLNVAANLKHVNTHENNNWRLVSALSLFVCSVSSWLLVLSSSVAQFLAHMIAHTVAQVCALFVSSSSPCLMHTLSDSLFDLSIEFTFLLFIPFIFLHILLHYTFYFLDVVDYNHAHCRWGVGSPGLQVLLHKLRAQRLLPHRDLCRVHPGVRNRATVPRRLGLRRRRYRSDALQRVPKTSRSLCRRRLVGGSVVVVNKSW